MTRIAILGGTFDPVHLGHLILAEETRLALNLDRVLFMPAAQPWRKADRSVSPAGDRLAMVRLAIAGNPFFAVSQLELQREGPTYTADTLDQLREDLEPATLLWFILGSDALFDLPHWKDPGRILSLARLAVAGRADGARSAIEQVELLLPGIAARADPVAMPRIEISSTELRRRFRAGIQSRYWLPTEVARYVAEHGLYRGR